MLLTGILVHLALVADARAQDANSTVATPGFDAHGFVLSAMDGDARDPLYNARPGRFEGGQFFVGGLFEYAKSPLTLVYVDEAGEPTRTEDVLDDVFALNVSGGVAVLDRVRLDLALPLYFSSSGQGATPQGFGPGDLRAAAMVAIVRPSDSPDGGGLGLGVVPYIDLPLGDEDEFLGQGGVAGGGKITATYELARLTVGGEVGMQFNPAIDLENLSNSDQLLTGLSVGYLLADDFGLNLEAHLGSPFAASEEPGTAAPAEAILSARKRTESGGFLVGGASAGIARGASAAAFRVFLGGGFGKVSEPAPRVVDTDGDGLFDDVDPCVNEPENKNGWKDEDGCPDTLPKVRVVVTRDGRPVDGADTTLLDGEGSKKHTSSATAPWEIESLPGKEFTARASLGNCLAGEGKATSAETDVELGVALKPARTAYVAYQVVDTEDKPIPGATISWEKDAEGCVPTDGLTLTDGSGKQQVGKGTYRLFATATGYATKDVMVEVPASGETLVKIVLPSTKVKVEVKQIAILDKVFFEVNSDVIKAESFELLNEVAAVIMANPQVGRVEVQGHTDSDGSDAFNLDLSDRRARSVMRYLISRGVAAERLLAKGYGESVPLATNASAAGKAKNRRVEFKLIDAPADSSVKEAPK